MTDYSMKRNTYSWRLIVSSDIFISCEVLLPLIFANRLMLLFDKLRYPPSYRTLYFFSRSDVVQETYSKKPSLHK